MDTPVSPIASTSTTPFEVSQLPIIAASTTIIAATISQPITNADQQLPTFELPTPEINKVGQSVFYDCIDLSPTAEKQDDMKPERSDTEEESMLQNFFQYKYL